MNPWWLFLSCAVTSIGGRTGPYCPSRLEGPAAQIAGRQTAAAAESFCRFFAVFCLGEVSGCPSFSKLCAGWSSSSPSSVACALSSKFADHSHASARLALFIVLVCFCHGGFESLSSAHRQNYVLLRLLRARTFHVGSGMFYARTGSSMRRRLSARRMPLPKTRRCVGCGGGCLGYRMLLSTCDATAMLKVVVSIKSRCSLFVRIPSSAAALGHEKHVSDTS